MRVRLHALANLAGAQAARVLGRLAVPSGAATIDHLMLLDPATAEQVAGTGVVVSYQPGFLPRFGAMLRSAGADRYLTVFGGRLLLDAGPRWRSAPTTPAVRLTPCTICAPPCSGRSPAVTARTAPSSRNKRSHPPRLSARPP